MNLENTISQITIPVGILWLVYAVALLFTVIASLALLYHWKEYSFGDKNISRVRILYVFGIIIIVGFSGMILLSF